MNSRLPQRIFTAFFFFYIVTLNPTRAESNCQFVAFWAHSSFSGSKRFELACWEASLYTQLYNPKERLEMSRTSAVQSRPTEEEGWARVHMGGEEELQSCGLTATLSGRKCHRKF